MGRSAIIIKACYRRAECTEVLWVHLHLLQHEYRVYRIKIILFNDDISTAGVQWNGTGMNCTFDK